MILNLLSCSFGLAIGLRLSNSAVLRHNNASVIRTHMLRRSPSPLGGLVDHLLYVIIDLTFYMRITKSFDTVLLAALADKLCQSGLPDKVAEPCDCEWIWTLDVNDTTK